MGKDRICGRGRNLYLQPQPGHYSRSEDHLRFLGHVSVEDGGAGGAVGALEHSSWGSDHPRISHWAGGGGIPAHGGRGVRQGCRYFRGLIFVNLNVCRGGRKEVWIWKTESIRTRFLLGHCTMATKYPAWVWEPSVRTNTARSRCRKRCTAR